ncbi:MAG: hypothetical protein R3197_17435 [Paracoccaceae bacterium]|nr:hypothetical protein [Paracoccaceae bacterium]
MDRHRQAVAGVFVRPNPDIRDQFVDEFVGVHHMIPAAQQRIKTPHNCLVDLLKIGQRRHHSSFGIHHVAFGDGNAETPGLGLFGLEAQNNCITRYFAFEDVQKPVDREVHLGEVRFESVFLSRCLFRFRLDELFNLHPEAHREIGCEKALPKPPEDAFLKTESRNGLRVGACRGATGFPPIATVTVLTDDSIAWAAAVTRHQSCQKVLRAM